MQNDNLPDGGDDFEDFGDYEDAEEFEDTEPAEDLEYKPSGNEWGRGHYISDNERKNVKKSELTLMRVFVVLWAAVTVVLLLLGIFVKDFPGNGFVYSLFGGGMIYSVLILAVKIVANARYKRGNGKEIKNFKQKIVLSVTLILAFGACGVCGFIFNIFWLMITGFAGLIVVFFIIYGRWF